MANLYIRDRSHWINFVVNDEVNAFMEAYQGQKLVVGDLALWSKQTRLKFLTFLESNPLVS